MKTSLLIIISSIVLIGCNKLKNEITEPVNLVSPTIVATQNDVGFTGGLQIYPCTEGTAIYNGNYSGSPVLLRSEPAGYVIGTKGSLAAKPPIMVEQGRYTVVYWGVPYHADTVYMAPAIAINDIAVGSDLRGRDISLLSRGEGDTTYAPTYDFVFQASNIDVNSKPIKVALRRVVAGVVVVVKDPRGRALDSSIVSITGQVSGLARSLNFFTAEPSGEPSTVSFPLTFSSTRAKATNLTAMVFPSIAHPTLTLIIRLANGGEAVVRTTLTNPLKANVTLKVVINISPIVTSAGATNFKVDQWLEGYTTIELKN